MYRVRCGSVFFQLSRVFFSLPTAWAPTGGENCPKSNGRQLGERTGKKTSVGFMAVALGWEWVAYEGWKQETRRMNVWSHMHPMKTEKKIVLIVSLMPGKKKLHFQIWGKESKYWHLLCKTNSKRFLGKHQNNYIKTLNIGMFPLHYVSLAIQTVIILSKVKQKTDITLSLM